MDYLSMQNNISQVTARSLGFEFPNGRKLFSNLSFTLNQSRYGLVGANGAGKSTLASLLAGELSNYAGEIQRTHPIVYLKQDVVPSAITVAEYLSPLWESSFAEPEIYSPLLDGIEMEKQLSWLSGGEWMRVRLAAALSEPCGLLILDEPTNNLDATARGKIYDFVQSYSRGLLIISHDRELLDHVDSILELSNQGLTVYGGNYSFYREQKDAEEKIQFEKLDRLRREKKKLEREQLEKLESQEKRMREGARKAARGGMPKILLGGRKSRAEETRGKINSVEEKRVESAQQEFVQFREGMKLQSSLGLNLPEARIPEGKLVFEINDFNFCFANAAGPLWKENLNLIMKGPRRWALAGDNGSGKSTLIQLLLSEGRKSEGTTQGNLSLASIPRAFLDQKYSLLEAGKSILENVMQTSTRSQVELRNELARFQFMGDQVHQKIESLSGGEKLKAALAKILLATPSPQFLILDEPTNNLDLPSLEILEQALMAFEGALWIVSHDEVFLKNIGIEEVYVLQSC